MSSNQTMTDVAYTCLARKRKEIDFLKLWNEVAKIMEIPAEKQKRKKSQFYSEMMMDSRFASLNNNKWDLRNRRKFEEVFVDRSEIELEDDEPDDIIDDSGLDIPSGDDAY
ncbi:MAG: DNA-directed RNA polymerase subunit delta [Solobacterium sp.]|nr:DNA-directed RNA polymerase subunit delta [Solobacterium sp.]